MAPDFSTSLAGEHKGLKTATLHKPGAQTDSQLANPWRTSVTAAAEEVSCSFASEEGNTELDPGSQRTAGGVEEADTMS